jgi:hypothetical protein
MVRLSLPAVEVIALDGTKSFWIVALPHTEAIAAVREVVPPDHIAELSIRSLRRSPKLGIAPSNATLVDYGAAGLQSR